MSHIAVKKGLDIPLKGKAEGEVLSLDEELFNTQSSLKEIALSLDIFEGVKLRLLVKEGSRIKIGQGLLEDKDCPGRLFVSPASGYIKKIIRGDKRSLKYLVIDLDKEQTHVDSPSSYSLEMLSRKELLELLKQRGMFTHIRMRPFNLLANPEQTPKSIFVKAVDSAPFAPPCELQVISHEFFFQKGLEVLQKLTKGPVHLVYHKKSNLDAFKLAKGVEKHTVEGPHPCGNLSVHIHHIDPIESYDDVIWTLHAHDVVVLGRLMDEGKYHNQRVISIAGTGIIEEKRGFFKVQSGYPIQRLIAGRRSGNLRYIAGNPLTGRRVQAEEFLGFSEFSLCALEEGIGREFLHFFRLGLSKYTASRAYLSGLIKTPKQKYWFSTKQHGESRAFLDASIYDKVMPMQIPTMQLVKAIISKDFEKAEFLGLLEVDPEDFALATFVCPSKIEMVSIVSKGLKQYADGILN